MTFDELPVGAKFRFFRSGLLLTKASASTYTALASHGRKAAADVEVLAEEDMLTPGPRAAAKPDDVALVSKALDELEAKSGKTPELAAARQALRRLDAMARLKTGG